MKLHLYILLAVFMLASHTARADTVFITEAGQSNGSASPNQLDNKSKFKLDANSKCRQEGYQRHRCPEGYTANDPCPYNPSMYKSCCAPEYKYTKAQCHLEGLSPSSKSCNGLYACVKE